jgi:two-component system CheB/CheR fusion protein
MLSNVVALVNQARREVSGGEEVYAKLVKRIEGLAATHSLLTSASWSSAPIRDVFVPETIAVYGEERVTLRGPDIRVNAQVVLSLGMAVHELATNAAKYGALSNDDGHVTLTWSRINDAEGDRLRLEWREKNGPIVEEPQKAGFGSRLIRSLVEGALGGKIFTEWNPSGISQVLELDYERVTDDGERIER